MVIPAHNEGARLSRSVTSISEARRTAAELEFVIVDDRSTDGSAADIAQAARGLDRVTVRVLRPPQRLGVPRARNAGARASRGAVLVMTDGHVQFSAGWDRHVLENIAPRTILAGTVSDGQNFAATGCVLAVPFYGDVLDRARAGTR